jgi:hypothetical protein
MLAGQADSDNLCMGGLRARLRLFILTGNVPADAFRRLRRRERGSRRAAGSRRNHGARPTVRRRAASIVQFSPQGTIKRVRQVVAQFAEPMVPRSSGRAASGFSPAPSLIAPQRRWTPPARASCRPRRMRSSRSIPTSRAAHSGAARGVILWPPRPGKHRLELRDASGRALDAISFQVRGDVSELQD